VDDEDLEIIMEDGDDFALDEGKPVTTKSKTSSMKNLKIVLKDKVENKTKIETKKPKPRYTKGVLAKYAKLAQSASRGAITE